MDLVTINPKLGMSIGIAAVLGCCLVKLIKQKYTKDESDDSSDSNSEDEAFFDDGDQYKLVFLIRNDLKMGKGKAAAQCAHAAIAAYKSASAKQLKPWERNGQAKITLKVDSEDELMSLAKEAKRAGLLVNTIRDAGRTQVAHGSKTVCAIGPGPASLIDSVTGDLKLY